jgi:hypothetical protein
VLLDENLEPLDFAALARFDVIGVTGMNVQKVRMREILIHLKVIDACVVVGGAYATVDPDYFTGCATRCSSVRPRPPGRRSWPISAAASRSSASTSKRNEPT